MAKKEQTLKERIKSELMRQREEMRKRRYDREFATIYSGNRCSICGRLFMTGALCRKHKGNVCARHCRKCEHFEPRFYHCLFRETEAVDVRKWRLIYGCVQKENLWQGIWQRVLLASYPILQDKNRQPDAEWNAAYEEMLDTLAERRSPKYAIMDTPDENGDYAIVDADTGEIQDFVAKYLKSCGVWACIEYLPPDEPLIVPAMGGGA